MDGRWRAAKHPLHAAWIENGRVFTEDISYEIPKDKYQGVGPGLQFARVLKNETRVPQGLICTAYGGSSLELWRPFDGMLYNALYNRFIKNGANAAGMLWFQGCADAFDGAADGFESNTVAFFDAVRKSMGVFPIIQFQIGRVVHPALPGLCENWMKIRDFQRTLYKKTDWLYTVSSIGCELDDLIHISADSADNLGKNAANIMLRLKNRRIQPPDLQSVTLCKDEKSGKAVIKIKFQNISGDLKSEGRPSGFTLSDEPYKIVNDTIFDIKLKGDTAFLYLWQTENEALGRYLCYGFGLNPYCNITDGSGSSLPCFGPIEIKE